MNSPHPSFAIPKRLSLSGQAAETLRNAIADGIWKDYLPGERGLCEMFQISRPTLRTALEVLAKDGLIEIRQGRRNRLLASSCRIPGRRSHLVGLVTTQPVSHMSGVASQGISEMRAHLAEHGFAMEILLSQPGSARVQQRKIEEFTRRNHVFCWVLHSVGKELQQWFATRSTPTLVLGSCHPKVNLPSLDIDYRSICRHAAGIFLGRGHRRLALVVPDSGVAGDLASEQGFRAGVEQHSEFDGVRAIVVRHNGTARQISSKLDLLFNSAHAPTALLVAKPEHVFIVLIYLLKRGLAVPDRVSFIARDKEHIFETVSPPIAHYSLSEESYAHRLSRLMLQMVTQGYLDPEPNLIFPKFFAGGTVRALI